MAIMGIRADVVLYAGVPGLTRVAGEKSRRCKPCSGLQGTGKVPKIE